MWIEAGGEVVAGDGKMDLLKGIDETGSIQKAAGLGLPPVLLVKILISFT